MCVRGSDIERARAPGEGGGRRDRGRERGKERDERVSERERARAQERERARKRERERDHNNRRFVAGELAFDFLNCLPAFFIFLILEVYGPHTMFLCVHVCMCAWGGGICM